MHKPAVRAMNDVAKNACSFFDDKSISLVRNYIKSSENPDGGFRGRDGKSDLYYTYFGLECAEAIGLDIDWDILINFLIPCTRMELDFAHTFCLIRCINKIPDLSKRHEIIDELFRKSETFRSKINGYIMNPANTHFSIYSLFLAMLTYEECGRIFPIRNKKIIKIINARKTGDGAFADQPGLNNGTTTVTSSVLILLSILGINPDPELTDWIKMQLSEHGGFKASPLAPVPDLLSTSAALFSLHSAGINLEYMKESTLDFIESIWNESGGFCGNLFDENPDVEYTYYALLSLGVLSMVENIK